MTERFKQARGGPSAPKTAKPKLKRVPWQVIAIALAFGTGGAALIVEQ